MFHYVIGAVRGIFVAARIIIIIIKPDESREQKDNTKIIEWDEMIKNETLCAFACVRGWEL